MANEKRTGTPSKSEWRAQSERDRQQVRTPGTPQFKNRQLQLERARIGDAIWESSHAPDTFDHNDW